MSKNTALTFLNNLYKRILSKFPSENLMYCFAYGSGVLKQKNNEHQKNMLDFILAVDNAEKWHENNLKMNPGHYSYLSLFGSRLVAKVQTNIPSRVYFNSMIPIKDENVVIKYGVITQNDLISDLLDWNDLYVAGRLHKPVKVVHKTNSEDLLAALQLNLQSAVHASLLLLPENFSEIQFYKTVASLSYTGDFRMKFGEDKNKVDNIVSGGLQKFRCLYTPILKMMEEYVEMPTGNGLLIEGEKSCRQDISPSAKHFHLNHLPRTPQRQLVRFWNKGSRNRQDTEDVLRALAFDQDCGEVVQSVLSDIVWDSSIKQSLKGILTADKKVKMSFKEEPFYENHEKLIIKNVEKSSLGLQSVDCCGDFFGPALPPHFSKINSESKEKETLYGPSLPNQLKVKEKDRLNEVSPTVLEGNSNVLIGPEIPKHLVPKLISPEIKEGSTPAFIEDVNFGPSTNLMATEQAIDYYKFLNTQNLPKKKVNVSESNIKRESWMIELPEKKRANFGLLRRHFKPQTQTEKESDGSVWTDTPANKKEKETRIKEKDHKEILKIKRLKERDKEMEKLAKKAAKRLKQKESLLEMHMKSIKKKKKKESKRKNKEGTLLPERRPFDRNIDLQICKYDESQKRTTLSRSQFLKDRFAPGQSRFL